MNRLRVIAFITAMAIAIGSVPSAIAYPGSRYPSFYNGVAKNDMLYCPSHGPRGKKCRASWHKGVHH